MRAVVYREPGRIEVAEVPRPELVDATDAIVRVQLSGICGTDLHVMRGDYSGMQPGMVVGHEFVGEVVEVGAAVKRFRLKDIVMSADFTACGHCRWCDEGDHWQVDRLNTCAFRTLTPPWANFLQGALLRRAC